ncbi:MAG: pyridoxal 5'-phosphate synthase glutaminase subunit PdxT [Thermoplasmata archaeon]
MLSGEIGDSKNCIGILSVQGDFPEHASAVKKALRKLGKDYPVIMIRKKEDIEEVTHLILPGGESTSQSILSNETEDIMAAAVRCSKYKDIRFFGTCAGAILLAKEIEILNGESIVKGHGIIDMAISRNAYGSQKDSFEAELEAVGVGKLLGVFIRAPAIRKVWGDTDVLAKHGEDIVLVKNRKAIAATFHPELTEDTRLYELFITM